ncbi:hypothetical protein RHS01_09278 [Rhizoctonia solani]|uniref:Uncharacterized protein n=1 Tax=Rhizoctonia solani TaxID=456999 RepID=A0A8H7I7D1_9AGAM|nr:hypothetical protein RHS01_09278 [Rhizoctonia solani]
MPLEVGHRKKKTLGHFVVAEYADKVRNKLRPTHPWEYAFGDTHVVGKSKLPDVINSVISSLATPDSESVANHLFSLATTYLETLSELPHNMLIVDTAVASLRHGIFGPHITTSCSSRPSVSCSVAGSALHLGNAGNDAWLALGAMIAMVDPNSIPLNTATIGGPLPSPLPYPPKAASPNGLPSPITVPSARPRYNSQAHLSPNSPSPLPIPGTPPVDGFPVSIPQCQPERTSNLAVFARPRTEVLAPKPYRVCH